ncbi:MAG: ATP-binding protein [Candidatus Competibacteraceae bacterium]|nr:ATP-binding protein [Candidatus Competibacteraceae bacterium]MBK7983577.1 ATP-binding protein [Candidatus Competibacteraceae bacterium]MBK8961685.1 ATP-binding protein [Candidatus Competibacteraceae bacterium]
MAVTRTISLAIESRPECIELLSSAVNGLCRLTALPAADIAQIELAVVEAVNNAVEHAYHGEPGHAVMVEFRLAPDCFTLLVRDRGDPMEPGKLVAPAAKFNEVDPEAWPLRGRGLAIIKSCMDSVEYHVCDGENTLTMNRLLRDTGSKPA